MDNANSNDVRWITGFTAVFFRFADRMAYQKYKVNDSGYCCIGSRRLRGIGWILRNMIMPPAV